MDYKDFRQSESCFSEVSEVLLHGFFYLIMIEYNTNRDEDGLRKLRPELFFEKFDDDSENSQFQNDTLRPILKLQHNVLLDFLLGQPKIEIVLKQKEIRRILEIKLTEFINQPQIKGPLFGMVIGHFTREEMKFYNLNSKDLNKRIKQMLLQRFVDSI